MHPRSGLPALSLVLAVAACGGGATTPGDEPLAVDIALTPASVTVERVRPASSRFIPRGHQERFVRFELRDAEGEVVTAGVVSDPRLERFEVIEPDGSTTVDYRDSGNGQLTVRLPPVSGELTFFEDAGGQVVEIGRAGFDPARAEAVSGRGLRRRHLTGHQDSYCSVADGESSCATLIAGSGSTVLNVDFVFVGTGFSGDEGERLHATARAVASEILASEDLGKYGERLNFWVLDDIAETASIPDQRDDPDAEGDIYRNDSGYPRWNNDFRNRMMNAVEFLDPETVVVIAGSGSCSDGCEDRCLSDSDVSDERAGQVCYNWGGVANSGLGFTVGNEGDPNLAGMLIHEVGHAYFELGDEYGVTSDTPCTDDSAASRAEYFDNLTVAPEYAGEIGGDDANAIYWEDMVTTSIIEPDFDAYSEGYDPALEGEVSVFVGGGTCPRRLARGHLQCRMKRHWEDVWCPVCERLVEERFEEWQGGDDVCPSRWDGDGICDPCLGDDSDCCNFSLFNLVDATQCAVRNRTCGNGSCQPLWDENEETCPQDCAAGECGNGLCEGTEADPDSADYCGADCGCGSVDVATDVAPTGCFCGPDCAEFGDCCPDSCDVFGNGC